jgi:hypothetical protein
VNPRLTVGIVWIASFGTAAFSGSDLAGASSDHGAGAPSPGFLLQIDQMVKQCHDRKVGRWQLREFADQFERNLMVVGVITSWRMTKIQKGNVMLIARYPK